MILFELKKRFVLEGLDSNQKYRTIRTPLMVSSLDVEGDYVSLKLYDYFLINMDDNSYFCYISKKDGE